MPEAAGFSLLVKLICGKLSAMVLSEELVNHPLCELVGMSPVEIMRARENARRGREAEVEREKVEKKEKKMKKKRRRRQRRKRRRRPRRRL